MQPAPVAVCDLCGEYTDLVEAINKRCYTHHGRSRCKGGFRSARNADDWERCPSCGGAGCDACQRYGVVYVRKG